MLFDNLRIDEDELRKFDISFINDIAQDYRSNTLYVFAKFMNEEIMKNDNN